MSIPISGLGKHPKAASAMIRLVLSMGSQVISHVANLFEFDSADLANESLIQPVS